MNRAIAEVSSEQAPVTHQSSETIDLRLTVNVERAVLQLHQTSVEDAQGQLPLARLTVGSLWMAYRAMSSGKMALSLSLPLLQATDLRPGLPDDHR